MRNVFIIAQVAISLVLMIGAGLFVRSLQGAQAIDLGFDPTNVAVMSVDLSLQGYDEARGRAFYDQLLERVAALPGVRSTTLAKMLPPGAGVAAQRGDDRRVSTGQR